MKKFGLISLLFILSLFVLRVYFGLQVNFSHADYLQVYLMGLEYVVSGDWPYWGPDVVWSYTRLAGGLQTLLVGLPIILTDSIRSPLIMSNIISLCGLVLLALYANKRFKNLPLPLILGLILILPFTFHHGSVLLNTSYLILTGSILFISTCELFTYRDDLILRRASLYFLAIGICLTLTFQLHLTWVMFIPFLITLLVMEYRSEPKRLVYNLVYLFVGLVIGGLTLWPTVIEHGDMIFFNTNNNLAFSPERFLKIGDLFVKYLGMATFDITPGFDVFKLAIEKSLLSAILIWSMKFIGACQFVMIIIFGYKLRKNKRFEKTLILFGLSMLMALGLYVLGNKHLSARTYILLFTIPYWISLHVYAHLAESKTWIIPALYISIAVGIMTFMSVSFDNRGDRFSFSEKEVIIKAAIDSDNPSLVGKRRINYMDGTRLRPPE